MGHNRSAFTAPSWDPLDWTRQVMGWWRRVRLPSIVGGTATAAVDPSYHALSGSTRRLCAAAQLDAGFRAHVLRTTVHERHQAIAPSYGIDVPQVVKHCLVANRRELIRDAWLTVLLITFIPALWLGTLKSHMAMMLLILTAAYAVVWIYELSVHHVVETRLRNGRFRPYDMACDADCSDTLSQVADRQNANLIVYGDYYPFVGSGTVELDRWPLTVDIRRAPNRRRRNAPVAPMPFQCRELYDHVRLGVKRLGLDDVTVEERLYVNGRSLREKPEFLPDRFTQPNPRVDPATLERFVGRPTQAVRHYQCIQAITWGGDLVISFLLRFEIAGGHLFAEATTLVLGPIQKRYRAIDQLPCTPLLTKVLHLVPAVATGALAEMPKAPLRLVGRVHSAWSRGREEKRDRDRISGALDHNYGALSSLRQGVSSSTPAHHFQVRDTYKYVMILKSHLIESIAEFLDEKGVDTAPLRRQGITVLNNIWNQGLMVDGDVQAHNVAGGKDASIIS